MMAEPAPLVTGTAAESVKTFFGSVPAEDLAVLAAREPLENGAGPFLIVAFVVELVNFPVEECVTNSRRQNGRFAFRATAFLFEELEQLLGGCDLGGASSGSNVRRRVQVVERSPDAAQRP